MPIPRSVLRAVSFLAVCFALLAVAKGGVGEAKRHLADPPKYRLHTAAELQRSVEALTDRVGPDARLLQVELRPGRADFVVHRSGQAPEDLVARTAWPGRVRGDRFPTGAAAGATPFALADLDASVPSRSMAEIEAREHGPFEASILTLRTDPLSGQVEWTIDGRVGARPVGGYRVGPDGRGLVSGTQGAERAVDRRLEVPACLREAAGDAEAVRRCLR
jgi:hypothetical protein